MQVGIQQNTSTVRKVISIFLFLISGFVALLIAYLFFPTVLSFDCFFGGECGGSRDFVSVDAMSVAIGVVFFIGAAILQVKAMLERKRYTVLFNGLATLLYLISTLFFSGFAKMLGFDF